jgi:hypothetical protein
MSTADLIALLTGIAGLIAAVGGILLAVRALKSRERKSAKQDLDTVNRMLADERRLRIDAERHNYDLLIVLAEHGIKPPKQEGDHETNLQ